MGDVSGRSDYSSDVFELSADGTRVVFRANPGGTTARRLFSAPTDGGPRAPKHAV